MYYGYENKYKSFEEFEKSGQCWRARRKTEECMPAEANLQKILIRHINFDTQNKSATSNSRMRFPGSRIAGHNDIFPFSGMK